MSIPDVPYWVEQMNGQTYFCIFLKKVVFKTVGSKWSVDYRIDTIKRIKSENVTYKQSITADNLMRVYTLIKQLPKEHIPGAVELYLATKDAHKVAI